MSTEMPFIERVRQLAFERVTSDDQPLPFYDVARELGASDAEAERIDEQLRARLERVMRTWGAL